MRRRYAQAREWLSGLLFRTRQSRELDEELRFHVEQEAARLERSGVPAAEARRRAAVSLGGVEKYKEQVRDAQGLGWVTGLSLDVRLGVRMLVKSWGLTLVGGLGMAVAIALGAVFHGATAVMERPLSFADGTASSPSRCGMRRRRTRSAACCTSTCSGARSCAVSRS